MGLLSQELNQGKTGDVNPAKTASLITEQDNSEIWAPKKLEAEIERQAAEYQRLEFNKPLKISANHLKDEIMKLITPQPEAFRGRFDIPVVVFGQIPPEVQAKLLRIDNREFSRIIDWLKDPMGYKTPNKTYLAWMQDGKPLKYHFKSADDVRAALDTDERGATILDGLGLYASHPNLLLRTRGEEYTFNLALPGSQEINSGDVPNLIWWNGLPHMMFQSSATNLGQEYRFVSCGK